ncbi:peptidoglycan editing factor PgeF [Virgibacillus xinjiangensis]|uniref:Purine nucleoside phosphorylase n=1 Tax=Virgibacillus xinjiangensis TaxID=393090 RepID=A0ABV7CVB2_9BACI
MQEPFINQDGFHLQIEKWQQIHPGLRAGISTRLHGSSKPPFHSLNMGLHVNDDVNDVITNRRQLAEHLKIPLEHWVVGEQVHQTKVKSVTAEDKGRGALSQQMAVPGTDGLITSEEGLLCAAVFADCVPLFFFDPTTGFVGVAHAGWKGTVQRIAEKMVEAFQKLGSDPSNLLAVIGPCISQENYEVDEHVVRYLTSDEKETAVYEKGINQYFLDLKQLNAEILLQAGLVRNNIDITKYCTYEHKELFFSHRRDQGRTGRMLGYIGYQP